MKKLVSAGAAGLVAAGLLFGSTAPAVAHAEGREWESRTFARTYHHKVNAKFSESPAGSCDTHAVTRTVVWSIYWWEVGDKMSYMKTVCLAYGVTLKNTAKRALVTSAIALGLVGIGVGPASAGFGTSLPNQPVWYASPTGTSQYCTDRGLPTRTVTKASFFGTVTVVECYGVKPDTSKPWA